MLVLCFELQSWRQKPGLFSREKPGLFVRSNPLFIGIIHLSLISLCVLCVLERLNHSDATGTDIIYASRTKLAKGLSRGVGAGLFNLSALFQAVG
ncbi:MAG TPA: hypothetical protein DCS91_08695 [Microcoleaceae bacterium UBA11344]|nr:hypothetical protein [Microcoleaceae cyanobacterium UBA11344]